MPWKIKIYTGKIVPHTECPDNKSFDKRMCKKISNIYVGDKRCMERGCPIKIEEVPDGK